jgi:very-short-patch-repair endonuclease
VTRLTTITARPTRSGFEDDFPAFARRHGFPEPEINAQVAGYEVDVLFRRERVIVELDSWEHHQSRSAFESDRERDAATLAAGHVAVRLTWGRYAGQPEAEAARLGEILRQRRQGTQAA